jgi:hypothetical protein
MDLIEVEMGTEESRALRPLAAQRGERMVLDLMGLGLHLPARGVGVAPLRGDRHIRGRDRARGQPAGQEPLGEAVGARGVEVAHASGPGGVQHRVRAGLHGRLVVVVAEIVGVAEGHVPRPAEGGQAEAELQG